MPNPSESAPAKRPGFPPDTAGIRAADWTVATDADSGATVIPVDSLDKTFALEELLYEQRAAPGNRLVERGPDLAWRGRGPTGA